MHMLQFDQMEIHFDPVTTCFFNHLKGNLRTPLKEGLPLTKFSIPPQQKIGPCFGLNPIKPSEINLNSCSSVVRALVCKPSGPGLNPCGIVQSPLVQGKKPI